MPVEGYYICKWSTGCSCRVTVTAILFTIGEWRAYCMYMISSVYSVSLTHLVDVVHPPLGLNWYYHFILFSFHHLFVEHLFLLLRATRALVFKKSFDPESTFLHYSKGSELNNVLCLTSQKSGLHRIYALRKTSDRN